MRTPSLFRRTILVLGAMVFVASSMLIVASWIYAKRAADDAYDKLLVGAALQMAESIFVRHGVVGVDPPVSAFETLALAPDDRIFYKVTDPGGTVLTGYDDLPGIPGHASPRRIEPTVGDGTFLDVPVRLALVERFLSDAASPGWAQVLVGQTRHARAALAGDITGKALDILAVMIAVSFVGVVAAVRFSLRPLRGIGHVLEARDTTDLAPLRVSVPREIRTLVDAINFFMERLDHRIRVMERFIADAAHQMRTPLTALVSQIDLLCAADEGSRLLYQGRVQERADELARLTNQLLNHAMVIHRTGVARPGPVDLTALARQVLLHATPLAGNRDLVVGLEAPPDPVVMEGDEVSLREAISNLVDNALRHGARSRLEIEVGTDQGWISLAVVDDGAGIDAADWERARKPFSTVRGTGSGLGLAIVDDVMRAHSGTLDFAWRPPGFAAVMRLPCPGPARGPTP